MAPRLSPFSKTYDGELFVCQIYVDDIIFGCCHRIDTADVLEQGLSRRAIALGSLKGLIGTKDTRESFYTSSAPYDEGKSLRLVGIGIVGVSITKRLNSSAWLSTCCYLP